MCGISFWIYSPFCLFSREEPLSVDRSLLLWLKSFPTHFGDLLTEESGSRSGHGRAAHVSYVCRESMSNVSIFFYSQCFIRVFVRNSFLIALLSYNSQNMQSTHLRYTIQWFLVYSWNCINITTINFRTFSSL